MAERESLPVELPHVRRGCWKRPPRVPRLGLRAAMQLHFGHARDGGPRGAHVVCGVAARAQVWDEARRHGGRGGAWAPQHPTASALAVQLPVGLGRADRGSVLRPSRLPEVLAASARHLPVERHFGYGRGGGARARARVEVAHHAQRRPVQASPQRVPLCGSARAHPGARTGARPRRVCLRPRGPVQKCGDDGAAGDAQVVG